MKNSRNMKSLTLSHSLLQLVVLVSVSFAVLVGCNQNGPNSMVAKFNPKPLKIPIAWHESFTVATEESKSTGKPILANFTGSDWCHWCVKLKSDVYETEHFSEWAKQNVVLVNLDYPRRSTQPSNIRDQNKTLQERYGIDGFPTVLLIDSNGVVLGKLGYGKDPVEWTAKADEFLRSGKQ